MATQRHPSQTHSSTAALAAASPTKFVGSVRRSVETKTFELGGKERAGERVRAESQGSTVTTVIEERAELGHCVRADHCDPQHCTATQQPCPPARVVLRPVDRLLAHRTHWRRMQRSVWLQRALSPRAGPPLLLVHLAQRHRRHCRLPVHTSDAAPILRLRLRATVKRTTSSGFALGGHFHWHAALTARTAAAWRPMVTVVQ